MGELVSVLMPIAPRSTWLRQAVDSLLAQTYQDWLLVAVLDGECERNRAVLEESRLADRLRLTVRPQGSGVATTLNSGLATISTDLVARMDADDVCAPDRLQVQVDRMRARPALLVLGSAATVVDAAGTPVGALRVPVGPERVRRRLRWRNAIVHPSVIMRHGAVVAAGGYDPRCVRAQDYDLWLRLATVGLLDNLARPLLNYRVHGGQHSRPVLGRAQTQVIRRSRRGEAGPSSAQSALADLRHAAWLTAQVLRAVQRG